MWIGRGPVAQHSFTHGKSHLLDMIMLQITTIKHQGKKQTNAVLNETSILEQNVYPKMLQVQA